MAKGKRLRLRGKKRAEEIEKKGKNFFQRNGYSLAVGFVFVIVLVTSFFSLYYRYSILKFEDTTSKIENVRKDVTKLLEAFRLADLGIRGYMIHQKEELFRPYNAGREFFEDVQRTLPEHLEQINFDPVKVDPLINSTREYFDLLAQMKYLVDNGQESQAVEIFKQDKGYDLWLVYDAVTQEINAYVNEIDAKSQKRHVGYKRDTLISTLLGLIFVVPVLLILYRQINIDNRRRRSLLTELDESNRSYVFDSRNRYDASSEDVIVNDLIKNLKKAAHFINNIAKENYKVEWEGITEENKEFNQTNIAGELVMMRDKMKDVKDEDEKRLWISNGLNKFSAILRNHTDDLISLSDIILAELVKYVNANQGGIFLLETEKDGSEYLELKSCYAFERKKYLEKKVSTSAGLIGQCYLEKASNYMEKVPDNYVSITSALGGAKPTSIMLAPVKTSERIEGVIEIAFLHKLQDYEIEFIKQLGELLAAEVINARVADKTKKLLDQTQEQAETLRAQEEEMRQNMEELQATQEQIHRKSKEYEDEIQRLNDRVNELESGVIQ